MQKYRLTQNSYLVESVEDGTFIPADLGNLDYQDYLSWRSEGNIPDPISPPSFEELVSKFDKDLDLFLDSKASSLTFSGGRISLVSRSGYPNKWQALAIAFGTWMDICNELAWAYLEEVKAGTKEIPADISEVTSTFPEFQVPEGY